MRLGRVVGQVVASRKDPKLTGTRLLLVQPLDHTRAPVGRPVVAADSVSAREGQVVIYLMAREASLAFTDKVIPSDCSLVGIVDHIEG